ncbi:tetratricopeptide repeat protein [Flocculibacter collagenilyticus]|uniref:tetratricopeptide repeat protein n=1 Tax=Flocculibacter collagenilyticus TaxID=2744479 RepID=UPI0018F37868|nr:tetratricopeptide repeat protein [Flocculibacter collagenilyticus]
MTIEHYISRITTLMSQQEYLLAQQEVQTGLQNYPEHGQLYFLDAAILAQTGEYERAVTSYQQAITYAPELSIARFQLGLLLATLEEYEASRLTLQPLIAHTQGYLAAFAQGLLHIFESNLTAATTSIEQGIALNQDNPSLNNDMQLMLTRLSIPSESESTSQQNDNTDEQEATDKTHLLDIYHSKH